MLKRIQSYATRLFAAQSVNSALSRAASVAPLRIIRENDPLSWEFSAFSQTGADGIIDYLSRQLSCSNRYFIEIGAARGLQNATSWLAIGRLFNGLMIEGDHKAHLFCKALMSQYNLGVDCQNLFVSKDSIEQLLGLVIHKNPDVMSIDIDGNDYYLTQELLEAGFKPRIFVIEYNASFGPDAAVTVKYDPSFIRHNYHPSGLYHGASVTALRRLLQKFGYQFISVDSHGVNAFFVDPSAFQPDFLQNIVGLDFAENFYRQLRYKASWETQFEEIKTLPLVTVT